MLQAAIELLRERHEFFFRLALEHLRISGTAIVLATIIGLALGIVISEYGKLSPLVIGVSNIFYTIPSIALLGFLIPVTGIGNTTAIIALTIYALLPIIGNTHTGLTNIDPDIIEAARGMGTSDWQLLWKIKLPLALPVILGGMKTMVVMTIALAGIASFIGAGGLGVAIYRGIATNNLVMTVVGSVLIALMAVAFDRVFHFVENRIPWKKGLTHE
ncbi:MAG: ABC transporter permease [Planctomycetaceae bacterium]|nr:ABC transporter permease [Planctomycetaceae bacterium]